MIKLFVLHFFIIINLIIWILGISIIGIPIVISILSFKSLTFGFTISSDDDDVIMTQTAVASGMVEGGSGYKVYFKLPNNTATIKLVNNDL